MCSEAVVTTARREGLTQASGIESGIEPHARAPLDPCASRSGPSAFEAVVESAPPGRRSGKQSLYSMPPKIILSSFLAAALWSKRRQLSSQSTRSMWLLTTRTAATVIQAASARQGVRSAPGFRGVRSGTLRAFSPKVAFAAGSTSPRGASSSKPKGVRRKRASPAPVEWHVYDENEAIAAEMTPSAGKRKADSDAGGSGGAKKHHGKGPLTSRKRWRHLRRGDIAEGDGRPILYVCDRDQRCADNWALLHSTDLARKHGNGEHQNHHLGASHHPRLGSLRFR